MPSICQGTWDCQICPKAVSNAITHVIYQRGFHKPAQRCEENFILFLIKGEMLVNSKEYAGTMLKEGEFTAIAPITAVPMRCLPCSNVSASITVLFNRNCFVILVSII